MTVDTTGFKAPVVRQRKQKVKVEGRYKIGALNGVTFTKVTPDRVLGYSLDERIMSKLFLAMNHVGISTADAVGVDFSSVYSVFKYLLHIPGMITLTSSGVTVNPAVLEGTKFDKDSDIAFIGQGLLRDTYTRVVEVLGKSMKMYTKKKYTADKKGNGVVRKLAYVYARNLLRKADVVYVKKGERTDVKHRPNVQLSDGAGIVMLKKGDPRKVLLNQARLYYKDRWDTTTLQKMAEFDDADVEISTIEKFLTPGSPKQPSAPNARIYRGKYAFNRDTLKAWYAKNQKGTPLEGFAFTETNAFTLLKIKNQEAKILRQEPGERQVITEDLKREAVSSVSGIDSVPIGEPLVIPPKPRMVLQAGMLPTGQ